ncbi:MAG: Gx transporter family protein [Lachnospiraceae bacterium]|nr:Gx transporter family protein [Lachnospiraceae bacterium]
MSKHTSTSKSVKRMTVFGLLIALAFVLSYLESLIPLATVGFFVPGMKIGLANIVVMVALYTLGYKDALILSVVRVILVGFTFGNTVSMMYSLAGSIFSFCVMALLKKSNLFSMIPVSIAGGIFHNVGQVTIAMLILEETRVWAYMPVLFVSGVITGVVIGLLGGEVATRIKRAIPD